MLTKQDEMLCHQIPLTFDHVCDSGVQWTERLWCNFYETSGKVHCTTGFGKYQNRNMIDAFTLLTTNEDSIQRNIRASRELRPQIEDIKVGPFSYDVVDGLKKVCWALDENDHGISFEVEFDSEMTPHEEVPQVFYSRGRTIENICRYAQAGRASGWVKFDGKKQDIKPDNWLAHRDHSWGVRRTGHGGEPGLPPGEPFYGLFFNWNFIQFKDWYITCHVREDHNGNVWYFSGGIGYCDGDSRKELKLVSAEHDYEFVPGTNRLKLGKIVYTDEDGSKTELSGVRPITHVYFRPGGYFPYKNFSHGLYMGPDWIDGEKIDTSDSKTAAELYTPADEDMCECRCGNEVGYGIVYIGILGQHPKYGP